MKEGKAESRKSQKQIFYQPSEKGLLFRLEFMTEEIFELNNLECAEKSSSQKMQILKTFLSLPVSSVNEVFGIFRSLDNCVEDYGNTKEGYLYVPGTREDRCLLIAHADTVCDYAYIGEEVKNSCIFDMGIFSSASEDCILGADDRAGCAMLWYLRNSGHSLLILDGEEHGQKGAAFLKNSNPALFKELNQHTFMLQLDRRGSNDYKCYRLPVTDEFKEFIKKETGYMYNVSGGYTDICTLCDEICAANLSVGYYDEHTQYETLNYADWENTLNIVEALLKKPLKTFRTQSANR